MILILNNRYMKFAQALTWYTVISILNTDLTGTCSASMIVFDVLSIIL